MIKYLGSKRLLAPALGGIASALQAQTAVDLFTGTTRVAQEFKRRGLHVTAVDRATYSQVLAQCFIETDAANVDQGAVRSAIADLNALPGSAGYFTRTFCQDSRFFRPENGARIDAIRNQLEQRYRGTPLFSILLTSLMLAADRVDSTTGVQMAYLKAWAPRAFNDLELRCPPLLAGGGRAVLADAGEVVGGLPPLDLVYLDSPYNQHRYFTNYHIWETLVRWDRPEYYGVACKRVDARDEATKSVFNSRRTMPAAFLGLLRELRARAVVVSYNNESWVTPEAITQALREAGHRAVEVLAFDSKRYVGAQIGIHSPAGQKVGSVSHLRNVEYVFLAGEPDDVRAAQHAVAVPKGPVRARAPKSAHSTLASDDGG